MDSRDSFWWQTIIWSINIYSRWNLICAHCSYLEIYISRKIRSCVVDLEDKFQTNLQAKLLNFLVWKFKSIILIFLLFFAEFVKSTAFYTLLLLFQRVDILELRFDAKIPIQIPMSTLSKIYSLLSLVIKTLPLRSWYARSFADKRVFWKDLTLLHSIGSFFFSNSLIKKVHILLIFCSFQFGSTNLELLNQKLELKQFM